MRTLDIGCGDKIYGSTDYADLYPWNSQVVKYDADNCLLPYSDNTFDEVKSSNLFEHLTNHANYMREVLRVLKPGGRHIIITDNALYVGFIKSDHSPSDQEGRISGNCGEFDLHFALFTRHHFLSYAKKFGYGVESVEYIRDGMTFSSNPLKHLIKMVLLYFVSEKLVSGHIKAVLFKRE